MILKSINEENLQPCSKLQDQYVVYTWTLDFLPGGGSANF